MSKRRRGIIVALLAVGFFTMLGDWYGLFGPGGWWFPTHQKRMVPTVDG